MYDLSQMEYKQDPFMNIDVTKERLRTELKKYGRLIIAYDFDYTLHSYRDESYTYEFISQLIRDWRPYAKFIVFTASTITRYPYIRTYLESRGIPYDTINEEIFERQRTRKLYYNIFLDDRAGLRETALILKDLLEEIKEGKLIPGENKEQDYKYSV